jgi:elongation factor 1-alpha
VDLELLSLEEFVQVLFVLVCRLQLLLGHTCEVRSIEMHHQQLEEASAGDMIGFRVGEKISVREIHRDLFVERCLMIPLRKLARLLQVIIVNHPTKIENGVYTNS